MQVMARKAVCFVSTGAANAWSGPVCFHYPTIRQSAEINLPTITMTCKTKLIHVTVIVGKS
jgi:hypothetical protein